MYEVLYSVGPTSLSVIETCLYLSQTLFIHTGQTTGLLKRITI